MIIQKKQNVHQAKADRAPKNNPLPKAPRTISASEELLLFHLTLAKCPLPEREFRFDAIRRWRFDFAYIPEKVAIEVEGGSAGGRSRHTDRIGFENDCIKYNAAAIAGWKVIRFTSAMIKDGRALATVELVVRELGIAHERPISDRSSSTPSSGGTAKRTRPRATG